LPDSFCSQPGDGPQDRVDQCIQRCGHPTPPVPAGECLAEDLEIGALEVGDTWVLTEKLTLLCERLEPE
jgi:hypothetical protein